MLLKDAIRGSQLFYLNGQYVRKWVELFQKLTKIIMKN